MAYFPAFYDLKNRKVYIFGGGTEALKKTEKLLPYGPCITVVSENIDDRIKNIPGVVTEERRFRMSDTASHPVFAVVCEERKEAEKIVSACRKVHVPVNAADMPDLCDFIFPSVFSSDHLSVGISSGGYSPSAAMVLKESIERMIPENIDDILEWMKDIREELKKTMSGAELKKALRLLFIAAVRENAVPDDKTCREILTEDHIFKK